LKPIMPHEVIKRVGRRAYRYRVESYRDPISRKPRSRWTYLGIVEDAAAGLGGGSRPTRSAPAATRERLLDGFERVLERVPYAGLTAGMVAAEAGLAHGTFYRYFENKSAIFGAAVERVRAEFDRVLPSFEPPDGSADEERARVRAWLETILFRPPGHRGVLRAVFEAMELDDGLRAERAARLAERIASFSAYLTRLTASGKIQVERPQPLAAALLVLADAVFRAKVVQSAEPDAMLGEGVVAVFERAIFGEASALAPSRMRPTG
jgi:AcrR family transcriptional regulator